MKKFLTLSLLCASILLAEDTAYITHTELGYVDTSGNTNTTSASLDSMGKKSWEEHSVQLDVDYLYGKQDGIENNNKLDTAFNYDYSFKKSISFNYLLGYKNDKFSGFDYQVFTGPGIKHQTIENDTHNLAFQSNILYSQDSVLNETLNYTSLLIKGDYTYNVTKSFKFIQMLSYRVNVEETNAYFINSKTSFISKISDIFSMGINYKIDYANTAPAGKVRTDKVLTASLIIDY
ncbi:DUF481 domain-containing protein [Sulfurimonas sp. MAG313]|nr:DUF481 domain-containing protein [Sulfurimonas sp. MAG313]MDF1880428.1 DUF481 domain-containing protein [Sulfurimonas sp. MAG313]